MIEGAEYLWRPENERWQMNADRWDQMLINDTDTVRLGKMLIPRTEQDDK